MRKNIFSGEKAIYQYLTPGALGPTPVVELPVALNPYLKDGVHIFLKLMSQVPLANIKSLPSWYMLESIPKNERQKIKNLVEYSSGNTALSLTILCQHFGIPNTYAIITPDVPKHKQDLLRLVGTKLIISNGPKCPDVLGKEGGIWEASQMGKKKGWKSLNQFTNLASPKASSEIIGRELYKQLGNKIDILCVAIGSGGTIVGSASYLKKKIKDLYVIAASIKEGSSIPGPRGEDAVKKLAFPWENVTDLEIPVGDKIAFEMSLKLIRAGLFVGPSTGMQLAAIFQTIKKIKKENFPSRKNINIVLVAGDTMFSYIEDYFKMLPGKI